MNTIGTLLHNARREKMIPLDRLSSDTKIKKDFILAIEKQDWEALPEYPVVLGFVRNIATSLDISVDTALALLRRDYPPKILKVSPSPDVEKKFTWSPKLTFLLSIGAFLFLLLGYLGFQYTRFVSAPQLLVQKPKEGEIILSDIVTVSGKTDTDVKVEVNNQPLLVDSDGNFQGEVQISDTAEEVVVVATSRSGKTTTINRKIVNESKN